MKQSLDQLYKSEEDQIHQAHNIFKNENQLLQTRLANMKKKFEDTEKLYKIATKETEIWNDRYLKEHAKHIKVSKENLNLSNKLEILKTEIVELQDWKNSVQEKYLNYQKVVNQNVNLKKQNKILYDLNVECNSQCDELTAEFAKKNQEFKNLERSFCLSIGDFGFMD